MAAGLVNRGILDPKKCWKDWHVRLGSLIKVREDLLMKDVVNPKTGNPPTISAIEKSAFSWAIQNQAEARKDLEYAWMKEGVILTDELWTQRLVNFARLVYHQRPRQFEKFIARNGLQRYAHTN